MSIKKIAEYQNIEPEKVYIVKCPACNNHRLMIYDNGKCECIVCPNGYKTVEELERIVEEDWLDDHRASKYRTKDNKGVGYE